jgi:hypothetical protein
MLKPLSTNQPCSGVHTPDFHVSKMILIVVITSTTNPVIPQSDAYET